MVGTNPITQESMFQPLLEADESFIPLWEEFVEEWDGEPEPPLYIALASVARHLVNQLETGSTTRFSAVFDVVELWHLRGDHFVREAATIGLLEALQNTNLHRSTDPADFEPWLRPQSMRWWAKVERFWSHGELLTDN